MIQQVVCYISELPNVECFSFCVNTILADVALREEESHDTVSLYTLTVQYYSISSTALK